MARKVLLADESVAVRKAVEATLEPKDFEVVAVSSGADALEQAKRVHPDVILLDVGLPDADGHEICRRLKEDLDLLGIPVIVMSAEGEGDPDRARAAGAEGYLAKPFQGNQLFREVMSLVDLSLEPTMKIETPGMENLDFEEEEAGLQDELALGELDLEGDGILDLTEEMENIEEAAREAEELEGFTFEEGEELDLEAPVPGPSSARRVKTEEIDEISFEEELEELDLGELEMEGADEIPSLQGDPGSGSREAQIIATDELEEGIAFDDGLSLTEESPASDLDLLGTSEDAASLELDAEEEPPVGATARPATPGLVDTDELEEIVLEEDTLDLGDEIQETLSTEGVQETGIDFDLEGEEPEGMIRTQEDQDLLSDTELSLDEGLPSGPEPQPLQETVIDWEEARDAAEEPAALLEETVIDWEEGEAEETASLALKAVPEPASPRVEDLPGRAPKEEPPPQAMVEPPPPGPRMAPREAAEPVWAPPAPDRKAPAAAAGLLEEVELEEEIAAAKGETSWPQGAEAVLEEIALQDVPPLEAGLRLELLEEDFGVVDFFSEEGIRREIARNLQDMVERILAEMAPPIVENVARGIALERAEKIVMEEIQRLRVQPEGA
jgi:DNA-binding response OmpR family regulator